MNAFKRGKGGNRSIYVPTRHGGLVQRSTGSAVPSIVRGMRRMVIELRDKSRASGDWAILDAIYAKRIKMLAVYEAYVSNTTDALAARLSSVNLSTHLDAWIAWVRAERRDDVRTPDVYWQQVTTLVPRIPTDEEIKAGATMPEPFPSSELNPGRVMAWLTSRDKANSGTRRKYFYALKSFVRYLVSVGVYATDPIAGMKAPKKNRARERWVTTDVDEMIVANALPKYRALFAFIKGTGCDVGSALRARLEDVNLFASTVNIRGTKTDRRSVHRAALESWALPYVREHLSARRKAKDGDPLLFPGITRNAPSKHHDWLTRVTLKIEDYTLKDARHSVGVRMRLAGKSFEEIAEQLGTSVFQAVTVYSRFHPDDERVKRAQDS